MTTETTAQFPSGDRPPPRAIIIDDEPLARARLRRLLEEQGITTVAEAEDSLSALARVEETTPDVAFLDIQMPGLTGMQLAGALLQMEGAPLIVFVTGYSQYAVEAFEREALDYLLKPISADRLRQTAARIRSRLHAADRAAEAEQKRADLAGVARQVAASGETLRRIPIKGDYAVKLLRLQDVVSFEARNKAVYVSTTAGEAGRTYYTLTQLETLLPTASFLRIHDSYIVNMDHVVELSFLGNHSYAILLTDNRSLPVGKTRYADLRRALGL